MERTHSGVLAPSYTGPIDVWDIDKTYLDTHFERLRDVLRALFESAVDKRSRAGVIPLLQGLATKRNGAAAPLYFISASPPQLRPVLEQKIALDGLKCNGMALKDAVALVSAGRLHRVRRHIAYKLTALLSYRAEWPAAAQEWLYGDDSESDALIYSLYARIRAGKLVGECLQRELAELRVGEADQLAISALASDAHEHAPGAQVAAIYIFRTPKPSAHSQADLPGVTFVDDALDLAHKLHARGRLTRNDVDNVKAATSTT